MRASLARALLRLWLARALHIAPALLAVGASVGCESEELNEEELREIDRVFKSGASFKSDPYVRAETLRVLELLADPRHARYALPHVEDSSDMVRVAALRVLLATDHPEAERRTLAMYTRAGDKTPLREAILTAAQEHGPDSLLRELYAQAMRSKDGRLQQRAFEQGMLERFDRVDEKTRKVELIPELSKLVDEGDERVAAKSLAKLIAHGRADRAEPLRATLVDEEAAIERRLRAARILRLARDNEARQAFLDIARERIEEFEESLPQEERAPRDKKKRRRQKLKLPLEKIDKRLEREAILGAVSLGESRHMRLAKGYLENASIKESLEVLEALSAHPSEDAHIALKIAMQDARAPIRYEAIRLYGAREDVRSKALIDALRQDDPLAKRMIATLLVERFPKEWSEELAFQFKAKETRRASLRLLRDVIDPGREDNIKMLALVEEPLAEIVQESASEEEEKELVSIAAYLLLLTAPEDPSYIAMLEAEEDNLQTQYVFIEQMVRTNPAAHIKLFRRTFYDDRFALRLMSAAGLWSAFRDSPALAKSIKSPQGEEGAKEGAAKKDDS